MGPQHTQIQCFLNNMVLVILYIPKNGSSRRKYGAVMAIIGESMIIEDQCGDMDMSNYSLKTSCTDNYCSYDGLLCLIY